MDKLVRRKMMKVEICALGKGLGVYELFGALKYCQQSYR